MQEKAKPVKVAFVLGPEEADVLEWQRKRLTALWAEVGYLREATLADSARTLIHIAAKAQKYQYAQSTTPSDTLYPASIFKDRDP